MPLQYDARMYRYVKAVKGVLDAAPELITNADDAYTRRGDTGDIYIFVRFHYGTRVFEVWDHATGMTLDEMKTKLGRVGGYTADGVVRGFFSRGAKDITRIGTVYFSSVCHGKFSKVSITPQDVFTVEVEERPVEPEDRLACEIPEPESGVHVRLELLPTIRVPDFERMSNIHKYFSLRDIFGDPRKHIMTTILHKSEQALFSGDLQYVHPDVEPVPLVDNTFHVPNWPVEAQARFRLYLRKTKADSSAFHMFREYGVLISTEHAIHDITTFYRDVESNPMLYHVYGRLECDYVDTLMREFDQNVANPNNTFPIVSHARTGLDRDHPFLKDLYRLPYNQLKCVLEDMLQNKIQESDLLFDLESIFQNLEFRGENIWDLLQDINSTFTRANRAGVDRVLTHTQREIEEENKDAVYQFQQYEEVKTADPGDLHKKAQKLKITIVNDLEQPFRSYFTQNVLMIDVSAEDGLIKHAVEESKSSPGSFVITDVNCFVFRVTGFVARSVASTVIDQKISHMSESEIAGLDEADRLRMRLEVEHKLVEPVFTLLSNAESLQSIVSNDVTE